MMTLVLFPLSPGWLQESVCTGKFVLSEFKLGLKCSHSDPLRHQIVISKMKNQLLLFSLKLIYFLGKPILQRRKLQRNLDQSENIIPKRGWVVLLTVATVSGPQAILQFWTGKARRWICRTDKDLLQDAYHGFSWTVSYIPPNFRNTS